METLLDMVLPGATPPAVGTFLARQTPSRDPAIDALIFSVLPEDFVERTGNKQLFSQMRHLVGSLGPRSPAFPRPDYSQPLLPSQLSQG